MALEIRSPCSHQIVLELVHGGPLTEVLGPTITFPEPCIACVGPGVAALAAAAARRA